ncbi:MAG: alpha/beta hydrolase, partial [Cyanobacteria bacterium J06632_3]
LPLEHIDYPVLLIVGAKDRLLPSKREAQMLVRRFPNAKMTLLPRSGHACLLEAEVKLGEILKTHRFLPNHSPSHLSTDADH